jgi:hypothetical protein
MFSPTSYFFVKKEAKKRNFKRKEEKEAEWDARLNYVTAFAWFSIIVNK